MFETGNCSKNSKDLSFTHEINVLLVIHDMEYLVAPGNLLESCSYKVIRAGNAATALSILSDGKFDLVLVDIGLNDFDAFKLVKIIVRMNLQAMILSPYEDDALRLKALASGASMLVRRPLQADVLKQIRQIVLRERNIDCERIAGDSGKYQSKGKLTINATTANNGIQIMENQNGFLPRKEKTYRKHSNRDQAECDSMPANNNDIGTSKKTRNAPIIWTQELHDKFMEAVDHLGEGGCYPKEILKHMRVEGLSRWHVASHLQKCRNNDWRPPEERKLSPLPNTDQISAEEGSQSDHICERRCRRKDAGPRGRPKRFGRYPSIGVQSKSAVHEGTQSMSMTSNGIDANRNAYDNDATLERSNILEYDQIFSDLSSDFSDISGRRQDGQIIDNLEKQTFDRRESGVNEGAAQTMEMRNNDIDVADYENSNDNFTITLERTSEPADQDYDPIFSDLGELTMPKSYHSSSLMDSQKQTHDDFHDFLLGMDDIYSDTVESRLPDEPIVNQSSSSQYSLFDFNTISPDLQDPLGPNRDMNGEWAGACTSLFPKPHEP